MPEDHHDSVDLGIGRFVDAIRDAVDGAVRGMLEAVPDATVIVDQSGTVVLVNRQAETLFGYSRGELAGVLIEQLIPHRYRGRHVGLRDRFIEHATTRMMGAADLDLRGLRKDGSEFPVEISLSPFDTGEGVLTISAIRDLTERREAEEARVRLIEERTRREQAENAVRERETFLSIAAHELRTPLTVVQGYSQLALRRLGAAERLEGAPLEQLRSTVQAIAAQSARANRLVEQLLESARIVTERFEVNRERADLGAIVGGTIEMARVSAPEERRSISFDERDHVEVMLDRDRFEQVMLNLLDNARKYSDPAASIEVVVERAGDEARVTVRDHGIGIPEDRRHELFQPFSRVHASDYRSGMGLGLYISRAIMEALGGGIAVDSPNGGGSRFILTLPLYEDAVVS